MKKMFKKIKYIFDKFEIFEKISPPLPHTPYKYQVIDIASSSKTFLVNKLTLSNLEQITRRIKSPLTR